MCAPPVRQAARIAWADYFDSKGVSYIFWSAKLAAAADDDTGVHAYIACAMPLHTSTGAPQSACTHAADYFCLCSSLPLRSRKKVSLPLRSRKKGHPE